MQENGGSDRLCRNYGTGKNDVGSVKSEEMLVDLRSWEGSAMGGLNRPFSQLTKCSSTSQMSRDKSTPEHAAKSSMKPAKKICSINTFQRQ